MVGIGEGGQGCPHLPPVGRAGVCWDCALAETVNGYDKAELIRGPARDGRPWKTIDDVKLATLSWVHWHNRPPTRLPRRRPTSIV